MPKRAKQSFAYDDESGRMVNVDPRTVYLDDDPVVKLYPGLFEDVQEEIHRQMRAGAVEQATAAPGEQRHTRRS